MHLEIMNYNGSAKEYIKVESYISLSGSNNLILVRDGTMGVSDEEIDVPYLEIYKVQFIASCKTKLEDEILVAFYFNEENILTGFIISGLPDGISSALENSFYLLDYKSYIEICDLTSETKLSFSDYFNEVKTGNIGINTILKYKGENLNYDQQKELWKKIEGVTI